MYKEFEQAINKIIHGHRISEVISESTTRILQIEEPTATRGYDWVGNLLKKIVNRDTCEVAYQPFDRESKLHIFSPYQLKEYRNQWYVIGFSKRAAKTLVLALNRITSINKSKDKFYQDPTFNSDDFFQHSFGVTQLHDKKPEQVILSFTSYQAPYILNNPLHKSQSIIKTDATELRIGLKVYITQELRMCILSYGTEVEVIEPQSLREELIQSLEKTLCRYK